MPKSGRPVECWQPIVSASRRGVDFMAKHGMKGFIGGAAAAGQTQQVVSAWRDAQLRAGRETEMGEDLAIGIPMYIADTEEKAIAEASMFFEENVKVFAPLGFVRGITDEQITALEDPATAVVADLPTLRDAVKEGSWLCGPPERIVERLQELQHLLPGIEHVSVGHAVGTPQSVVLEQLGLVRQRGHTRLQGLTQYPSQVLSILFIHVDIPMLVRDTSEFALIELMARAFEAGGNTTPRWSGAPRVPAA